MRTHGLIWGLLLLLAGCGTTERSTPVSDPFAGGHYKVGRAYTIKGRTYYPVHEPGYDQVGIASWYGDAFHRKPTANGEIFDKSRMTAAHKTMALPSIAHVTNLENGRMIEVRVNDRGPFVNDRIIDLSEAAATRLGFQHKGLAKVRVRFVTLAPSSGRAPTASKRTQPLNAGSTPKVRVSRACPPSGHFVQIGAFSDQARAAALTQQARSLGFSNVSGSRDPKAGLHKVRAGPFDNITEAEKNRIRLAARGFQSSLIIQDKRHVDGCS